MEATTTARKSSRPVRVTGGLKCGRCGKSERQLGRASLISSAAGILCWPCDRIVRPDAPVRTGDWSDEPVEDAEPTRDEIERRREERRAGQTRGEVEGADGLKPVQVPASIEEEREAIDFTLLYAGRFPFMIQMKARVVQAGNERGWTVEEIKALGRREWDAVDAAGVFSPGQVRAILRCKGHDSKREEPTRKTIEEGMYRDADGTIFKVQKAVHGSGRLYAKRLVQVGESWKFEYDKGAVYRLTSDDRMTLEQAKEFGALYGTCCVCGRTLTDERSIEAGIGPVCGGRV